MNVTSLPQPSEKTDRPGTDRDDLARSAAEVTTSRTTRRRQDHDERSRLTSELFAQLAEAVDDTRIELLLERVITINIPVAEAIASRYHQRGVGNDDIDAVARLGLVKAAQRFDPSLGHDFLSFAVPTIRGEVRRFFRDFGWFVRPPRRVQELQQRIVGVESELGTTLGHRPDSSAIALEVGCSIKDVEEAHSARGCFGPTSLSASPTDATLTPLSERLGEDDPGMREVEVREMLRPAVGGLKDRDKTIIKLRFYDGLNQYEIAQQLGITQVQVSRLLQRIMRDLRLALEDPASE